MPNRVNGKTRFCYRRPEHFAGYIHRRRPVPPMPPVSSGPPKAGGNVARRIPDNTQPPYSQHCRGGRTQHHCRQPRYHRLTSLGRRLCVPTFQWVCQNTKTKQASTSFSWLVLSTQNPITGAWSTNAMKGRHLSVADVQGICWRQCLGNSFFSSALAGLASEK